MIQAPSKCLLLAALVALPALGCGGSGVPDAGLGDTAISRGADAPTLPDSSTSPDAGPSPPTRELPAAFGTIDNVQLNYEEASNVAGPLFVCLTNQMRRVLAAEPADEFVTWAPPGLAPLTFSPSSLSKADFNAYAAGRAIYAFEQDGLLEPETPDSAGLYGVVRYMFLALVSVSPEGWAEVPEPGTFLMQSVNTPEMADVGILRIIDAQTEIVTYAYLDLTPCAGEFFQTPFAE